MDAQPAELSLALAMRLMKSTNMNKRAKILDAHMRAGQWLSHLNELEEKGKANTKAWQEAERKAQFWLDRLNTLEGYID